MAGTEIRLDLIGVSRDLLLDGERMAEICSEAAKAAGATIKQVVFSNLGEDSPPGMTLAILLDESHITAHSYADDGLLAINVFTPASACFLLDLTCGRKATEGPDALS